MKKREIVQHAAELKGIAAGNVADQMDKAVHKLIRGLRKGKSARLPGLGTITPGKNWGFSREADER